MPPPKKGDPKYPEYLKGFNERRRKRRENPEYKAKEVARQRASRQRRREQQKAAEWERRYGKEG